VSGDRHPGRVIPRLGEPVGANVTELAERLAVRWRIHLTSAPEKVHRLLTTDQGRARFWAETTSEANGAIDFRFPDGALSRAPVRADEAPHLFVIDYLGHETRFDIVSDGAGGTDLTLTTADADRETYAGWVSVLLALKAAADFAVDLRNHDPARTWRDGYADN
jgi:hypothetical protein